MKKRNNLIRWIVLAVIISAGIYAALPSIKTYFLADKEAIAIAKDKNDLQQIKQKISEGQKLSTAEQELFARYGNDPAYQQMSDKEIELYNDNERNKAKSIGLGLDLQGGMHIVLEIEYQQMLKDMANPKDERLEKLLAEANKEANGNKEVYFESVKKVFDKNNLQLNNYWGRRGQSQDDVVAFFDSTAKKGIVVTLEKLRNRIDKFGIAEPIIQKQGDHRIIVELPGVKDEDRATSTIQQTAFLQFKILADAEAYSKVLESVDRAISGRISTTAKDTTVVDSTSAVKDSALTAQAAADTNQAKDATKLFKGKSDTTAAAANTANKADVASKDKPFTSLLLPGPNGQIMVLEKNRLRIDHYLAMDQVRAALGKYEFVWKNKPVVDAKNVKYYDLTLVNRQVEMDGTAIAEASALMSQGEKSTGGWEVSLELTDRGAKKFENVTGKNVGKQMAIILDGKLIMAPNINERIPSGRAQITGNMGPEESRDLANVLTSALPAPIDIVEKRVIGPSLGSDAINSGLWSAIIGYVLVLLFLAFYYKLSGMFALVTISLNTFLMIAALCYFKATLTLPGIAGIVLSMAMAVDANVLIFERIKEELANGKTVFSALNAGYEKAFSAIFDSNITTILAGIVLYQYGTGPIRGFALTLLVGVVINLYTAVVVTRLLQDMFVKKDTQKISI